MEPSLRDKSMLGGIRTEADIWADCVSVILDLLDDSLLKDDEQGEQYNQRKRSSGLSPRDKKSTWQQRPTAVPPVSTGITTELGSAKRKRSFTDSARDRKMQKISSNLANEVARSLSVSDHTTKGSDDADVTMHSAMEPRSPRPLATPRSFRKTHRRPAQPQRRGFRLAAMEKENEDTAMTTPTFRRFSLGINTNNKAIQLQPQLTMDFDQWLKAQAQRQNLNMFEYRQLLQEKQKQLHHYLTLINEPDRTKTDAQRYQSIKDNLARIVKIADDLSGDHSFSFSEIYPEWRMFEGHVNKIAAYVQSIEDMKQLTSESIPRTSDLLHDIRCLQAMLDGKCALYGDNLVQNGLEWKAMGMPVDEQLLAAVKGWFYNLCIALIAELDTECSKMQSLVTDIRELVYTPEGEKLMESILCGLEFVSATLSFIGLPSKKLDYGCRVLATIYGRWIAEHLEQLCESQQDKPSVSTESTKTSPMDVKMTSITQMTKSGRVDIRLMQLMDSMTRILASLQILQEIGSTGESEQLTKFGWDTLLASNNEDSDSLAVLENLASILVEITLRAISVIETCRNQRQGTSAGTKTTNIMANPEMTFLYMEESVLAFADRVIELSGKDHLYGARIQRLHAHLEDIEATL